jgi:hypothetical protein
MYSVVGTSDNFLMTSITLLCGISFAKILLLYIKLFLQDACSYSYYVHLDDGCVFFLF